MNTTSNVRNPDAPIYPETTPMASDAAKADSKPDRMERSLVRDLDPGAMKPANAK